MTAAGWPLGWIVAVFLLAGAITVVGAVRLAGLGDPLADRTGWGEAFSADAAYRRVNLEHAAASSQDCCSAAC